MAWLVALLAVAEVAVRLCWTALNVSPESYYALYPGHDYGFALVRPPCVADGAEYVCLPHRHARILPQRFPRAKPARTLRLLTVGSSIAETGKPPFPMMLPDMLAKRCQGRQFQSVNLAAKMFGTQRSAAMLEAGQAYDPDVIIVEVSGTNERNDFEAARALADESRLPWGLLLESEAVVLGRRFVEDRLAFAEGQVDRAQWGQTQGFADPVTQRKWLSTMIARSRARHQPVVLVGRAEYTQRGPGWKAENIALLRELRAPDVALVDGQEVFDARDRPALFLGDWLHYTQLGHWRMAKAITNAIVHDLRPLEGYCGH